MTLQWLAVDLLTGRIICDLPSLESKDPFRRTIGQYETSTATLTITDTIDPDWERGILEGASACIAYRGDPSNPVIEWGGIVTAAPRTLGNTVELSLITVEGYLDGRFVGPYSQTSRDQNLIVSDLVTQFAADTGGMPITVQIVGGAGTALTRQYNAYDDKTVYACLQELMGALGGPEWTMHWQWTHGPERITPVLYVGNRIGTAANAGMQPAVTFESENMLDLTVPRSWKKGDGANLVTATGTGSGLARSQVSVTSANLNGRPKWEYRWAPSTSIFDTLTLTGHANRALGVLQAGNQSISFSVRPDVPGQQLGNDWNIGDDIGYNIGSLFSADNPFGGSGPAPGFPAGLAGTARAVGYESTDVSIKPLIYAPKVV